ncbi:unnamed protein product [Mesocestoides corti]|uniref:Reverse transcriptase n=1 Tax=Mesocestoides corti TaxID=53468 RepID=A0A0R3U3X9_MESCO|nr:unnamed protein product [Mesocestoides corti]
MHFRTKTKFLNWVNADPSDRFVLKDYFPTNLVRGILRRAHTYAQRVCAVRAFRSQRDRYEAETGLRGIYDVTNACVCPRIGLRAHPLRVIVSAHVIRLANRMAKVDAKLSGPMGSDHKECKLRLRRTLSNLVTDTRFRDGGL